MMFPKAQGWREPCVDENIFCPCPSLPVIMQMIPNRCVPIGKKEILYMGPFGLACWFSGIVFIDRKKREESIAVLTEMAHTMRKDNVSGKDFLWRAGGAGKC